MTIKNYMQTVGRQAREASRVIAAADTALKNRTLLAIADALNSDRDNLLPPMPRIWKMAATTAWMRPFSTDWNSTLRESMP